MCIFGKAMFPFHSGEVAPRPSICQDSNLQVVNAGVHHICQVLFVLVTYNIVYKIF